MREIRQQFFTSDFFVKYPDQLDGRIKGINKGMVIKSRIVFWCKPINPDVEKNHLLPHEDGLCFSKNY